LLSAFPTAIPFLTVYAREVVSATELQIVWFTGILSIGRIIGQPIWGHMADRHGNALALFINIGLGMLAVGLTFTAKSILVFYLIFALVSISRSGLEIPGMNITMEFATPENLPTYVALRASIIAPFRALLPICVSPLITSIGYQPTFAGLTMMLGLSWWFMNRVRDPRFIS
jgi:MFS family permease